jgi:hypothetical protein
MAIGKVAAEPLRGASATKDKNVSFMPRAHRLPAILICLLIAGVVLSMAATSSLDASAHRSSASASRAPGHGVASSQASNIPGAVQSNLLAVDFDEHLRQGVRGSYLGSRSLIFSEVWLTQALTLGRTHGVAECSFPFDSC